MSEGKKAVMWIGIGCGIAALVALIGLVTCLGLCGAGLGGVFVATEAAAGEVGAFFGDLRAGNVEAAYSRMSDEYRSAHDLEAFRQNLAEIPAIEEHSGLQIGGRHLSAGSRPMTTLIALLSTPGGVVPVEVRCVGSGERWLIDSIGPASPGAAQPWSPRPGLDQPWSGQPGDNAAPEGGP